ncbi:OmpA/MotB family protein [Rhodobaculum claviforme]|uniref:Chemotaxis protein MotB n=1 Tax=Rhodobaculum claviforme TaxID=1549854 RepID=A0A934TMA6_9RHOB|nr:flagellar motor protein MotB [Rhodobaculum claviforme]MBK5927648.1 hypothetical protein [Rhodobaculum claviforme]
MDRHRNAAPAIIKRKRIIAADEHHGGAWKIAFADFATAMMAFFLVMWLINATDEQTRKGLAEYFSPTIALNRNAGGSDSVFGGHNVMSDAVLADSARHDAVMHAEGEAMAAPRPPEAAHTPDGPGTTDTLDEIARALRAVGGESVVAELALRHIVTRVTDEGLIVEIFDMPGQTLFAGDSDVANPVLVTIAGLLHEVFGLVDNGVAVDGHTRTEPVIRTDNPVWALSTARAQRMRELLQEAGIAPARMHRVTGHADRQPAARNPAALRNNRLEVVLLRDGAEAAGPRWH